MKHLVKNSLTAAVSLLGVALTFWTLIRLVFFLSKRQESNLGTAVNVEDVFIKLSIDLGLLAVFMFQHSFMKSNLVNQALRFFQPLDRVFYVICTDFVLLFLIDSWRPIPELCLWNLPLDSSFGYAILSIHVIAWYFIYAGSLIMDLGDLMGIKQVYYDLTGMSHQGTTGTGTNATGTVAGTRTPSHNRLLSHLRHGSLIGFSVVFNVQACMTVDRLMLSVVWTMYMYFAWRPDRKDLQYQRSMWRDKQREWKQRLTL